VLAAPIQSPSLDNPSTWTLDSTYSGLLYAQRLLKKAINCASPMPSIPQRMSRQRTTRPDPTNRSGATPFWPSHWMAV
jgi:hypothetical protein